MEDQNENPIGQPGGREPAPREVDQLAREVRSWWGDTFVFIKKTRVRTWLGIAIVAFVAGAVASVIMVVSNNIQTSSEAAGETASLTLSVDSDTVAIDDTFDMDITLNTSSSNAVVVKAVVNYNHDDFQLTAVDTETGDFEIPICSGIPTALCAIVEDDAANGKVEVTVSKPAPGINSSIATVATLTFKALRVVVPSAPNFTLSFTAGSYADSDVILEGQDGVDILNNVNNTAVIIAPELCTQWTYSEWEECQADGTQERTILTSGPEGCAGGDVEDLERDCEYIPPVCTEFTYTDWSACQPNGTQSRTATPIPAGCDGGIEPVLIQNCEYTHQEGAPTCSAFVYSDWSTCQIDNTQSRTVASSSPAECTGGSPILSQACTYVIASNTTDKKVSQNKDKKESHSKPKPKPKPKRYIRANPETLKRGSVITESGKKFTKNSLVRLYFSKPGGGYYPPRIVKTDSAGWFWITYRIPMHRPPGKYTWYAVDVATGKQSKEGHYTVK